ncbi:uncharacterized protein CMU_019320 [Cryptosporidium muris RN66]|uniref:Uncharacterized protein n=1 Tax=Cryptosporidium muris (strain RN66) TaxID=441375 RepID=B6ACB9_CRYMR|nr:uncharacterized protein CMU_019320 [Cryptosporidium muris RN66]EEA06175.1 hypothetical protein CMU_019320 [Cryptosporidium muris RN66]|eukprot:XP_002140524.1 hypothetical protein [Cryptosporidium muris RN66]
MLGNKIHIQKLHIIIKSVHTYSKTIYQEKISRIYKPNINKDEDHITIDINQNNTFDDKNIKSEVEEYGFKYEGLEPTTYGDWSHKGRVTDF